MRRLRVLLSMAVLLASCAPSTGPTVVPEPSVTPTSLPEPTSTPVPPPTVIVAELAMRVYQVAGVPGADDEGHFITIQGESFDYPKIIALSNSDQFLDNSAFVGSGFSMSAELDGDELVANEVIPDGPESAYVTMTRAGHEIFRISGTHPGVAMALRGLWTYNHHWVLEVGFSNDSGSIAGTVILDGVSLSDQLGYEESFGFQTIHDKPFYFFQRNGVVDAWYDGQEIPLGFERVPHYGCCSAGFLNPLRWTEMVAFFGIRDGIYYFVQMGTPDSFAP